MLKDLKNIMFNKINDYLYLYLASLFLVVVISFAFEAHTVDSFAGLLGKATGLFIFGALFTKFKSVRAGQIALCVVTFLYLVPYIK